VGDTRAASYEVYPATVEHLNYKSVH